MNSKIHIIYVVDTSISMSGMFIESAKEAISEIANNIDGAFNSRTYHTLITCDNSAIVCFEHKLQKEISFAHLTSENGLSNLHEGIRKSIEVSALYKEPTILVCFSDLNVTSTQDVSSMQSTFLKSANIVNIGTESLLSDFQSDFSIYSNNESQLNDLCKKLVNKIEEITTGDVSQYDKDNISNKEQDTPVSTQDSEDWNKDFK